jgi:DNA-binding winged helix-turn-helix (wHTH) protein
VNESAVHYRFGRFQFILPQLTLTRDGEPVKLGGRALNLLAVLAEANGSLVTRSSLLESVWPGQAIDESAIRVHLSAVRKALAEGGAGESAIVNEAGRGYRLALPVVREAHGRVDEEPIASTGAAVATPLPVRLGSRRWRRNSAGGGSSRSPARAGSARRLPPCRSQHWSAGMPDRRLASWTWRPLTIPRTWRRS